MMEQGSWRAAAVRTGAGDRTSAEEGVRLAYRQAGLDAPARIVWARSPHEAVRILMGTAPADGTNLGDTGPSVREAVVGRPWAAARDRAHRQLGPEGWSGHWRATGAALWESTRTLTERLRSGIVEDLATDRHEESLIRLLLLDAALGQHDAPWLSAFDAGDTGPLAGIAAVARDAGWWWPYEKVAVISERPLSLHRDEAGRLDRGDGPALAYGDGFELYAWRGMPVPSTFLDELTELTPERIRDEENAELRRVMLEHYGYDRYLEASGAVPVHRDETGVLWRVELVGDEDVVMVEVINSTPEPDGTSRTYWLRVPPSTRTAREGVAWTFGLGAEVYEPAQET
ncbi:DUF6745 domain-containing protein [Streptomyces sp. NPDC059980]|uniref:DUF6745 domain-containing protein n=1 Tax=Streptomyces sp. NPDC059980 TaxID=3347022 RepID=UPI0036C9FA20